MTTTTTTPPPPPLPPLPPLLLLPSLSPPTSAQGTILLLEVAGMVPLLVTSILVAIATLCWANKVRVHCGILVHPTPLFQATSHPSMLLLLLLPFTPPCTLTRPALRPSRRTNPKIRAADFFDTLNNRIKCSILFSCFESHRHAISPTGSGGPASQWRWRWWRWWPPPPAVSGVGCARAAGCASRTRRHREHHHEPPDRRADNRQGRVTSGSCVALFVRIGKLGGVLAVYSSWYSSRV